MSDRLVIVSNRLPVVLERSSEGRWTLTQSSGGLVAALGPVLRNRGGMWIGWSGVTTDDSPEAEKLLKLEGEKSGYDLRAVPLTQDDVRLYYHGFSNEILWPLFHDLQSRCNFDPGYWAAYQAVNRKFAAVIKEVRRSRDFIWVHDYQLLLVGHYLRALGVEASTGFFLHIPFPPLDIFLKLPWRFQILQAMLDYDLIGFQTMRDRRNFMNCVRTLLPDVSMSLVGSIAICTVGARSMRVGCFPISIDFAHMAGQAASPEISNEAWYLHERYSGMTMILGVDRLDYTKGIPDRLRAFENLLERFPDMRRRVSLIQVVVPSRTDIPEYHELKTRIERMVGEINGAYSLSGWVPIHYQYRSLNTAELLAHYRACEVACITPLKDGMNLIAKEYCTSKVLNDGVLILSEFAGATAQMQRHALLVNPYDIVHVADTMYRAVVMPPEEQRHRMRRLRSGIKRQDVFWWLDMFLDVAFSKDLVDFPVVDEYIPALADESHSRMRTSRYP